MAVTVSTFTAKTRFQKFLDSFEEDEIADAIADVYVDWDKFLTQFTTEAEKDRAVNLLTCHRLTQSQASDSLAGFGAPGAITSISASQGSQSVSFGSSGSDRKTDPEGFADTACGREFLVFKRRVVATGFVA